MLSIRYLLPNLRLVEEGILYQTRGIDCVFVPAGCASLGHITLHPSLVDLRLSITSPVSTVPLLESYVAHVFQCLTGSVFM